MANGDGTTYDCHCFKPWSSVIPPPYCSRHGGWVHQARATCGTSAPPCRGRHCRHDAYCRGGVIFNG